MSALTVSFYKNFLYAKFIPIAASAYSFIPFFYAFSSNIFVCEYLFSPFFAFRRKVPVGGTFYPVAS